MNDHAEIAMRLVRFADETDRDQAQLAVAQAQVHAILHLADKVEDLTVARTAGFR